MAVLKENLGTSWSVYKIGDNSGTNCDQALIIRIFLFNVFLKI